MNWTRVCLVLAGSLIVWPAGAQTDAPGLQDLLKGKPFFLQNYSAERVAQYAWVDGKLVDTPPGVRTLGVFRVRKVTQHGQKILISGTRATLVGWANSNRLDFWSDTAMEIQIDLSGAEAPSVLPRLAQQMFFADTDAAISALPAGVKILAPSGDPRTSCKCFPILTDHGWIEVPTQNRKFISPELRHDERPQLPHSTTNGMVKVLVFIQTNGVSGDLWLLKPLEADMDRAAETLVRTYRFLPALYNKQPVGLEIAIEVNSGTG